MKGDSNNVCIDACADTFWQSDVPKAVIRVADLNAVLSPDKMRQPYGMQLLFEQNHATRSIYVYAESAVVSHIKLQTAIAGCNELEAIRTGS